MLPDCHAFGMPIDYSQGETSECSRHDIAPSLARIAAFLKLFL